ncbi:MAG TPA: hypothetical protein VOB72_16770 [Candidatus Dormibacteraeota bacterium]|nr:hypothetical protein [Candidatus Dormibacteraeota bacterium]
MQQHWAPPQYSDDGRWWWNGQRWVPVTWPVPGAYDAVPPEYPWRQPERRRRTPGALWIALLALILLLVLAAGGGAVTWIAQQGPGFGLGARAGPAAPTIPAPAPGASPATGDASATVDGYRQLVAADASRFQSAGQAVADRCSPSALRSGTGDCQDALQSLDDATQRFRSDLDAHPAPSCLQPADQELRTALDLYHQGAEQELTGLRRGDALAVVQGAGALRDATGHAESAASLLSTAC